MNQHDYGGEPTLPSEPQPVTVGRYLLHRQIARGGMATIHIARLLGDEGFSRIVAAKRLLPEFAENSEFVAMFLDEARIASRVHHRNVVPVLDVVTRDGETLLVQEYIHGVPLHWLLRAARRNETRIPFDIAVSIACQVLAGLHAAHETRDEMGAPLEIVHRDVSPQNVMIAVDGTARLLDFGIAKATMAAHVTREGHFKGKLAYAAPEQLCGKATRQSDLYSLSVLLWELIVGHHMHHAVQADVELVGIIMNGRIPTITQALAAERESLGPERWRQLQAIEPIIKIGLSVDMTDRWTTAADMEQALIDVMRPASSGELASWLKSLGREFIDKHDRVLAAEEASWLRLGATMRYRLTPVPGEIPKEISAPSKTSAPLPLPPLRPVAASWRFGSRTVIAMLCGLVVALAIGFVLALRGSSAKPAAAAAPPTVTPIEIPPVAKPVEQPAAPPAPAMPPAAVKPLPEATAAATPAAAPPAEPAKLAEPEPRPAIELPVTRATSAPPVRAPANRQPTVAKKPPPAPAPTTAGPPPRPATDPPPDCDPPYYYEGPKKVFKPGCL